MNSLDEAELVHAAAIAAGLDADEVLEHTDMAALCRVVAVAEEANSTTDRAGALLAAVLCHEPFPVANAAAGWLAACMVLRRGGLDIDIAGDDALTLIDSCVATNGLGDTAAQLRPYIRPRVSRRRRVIRWLFATKVSIPQRWQSIADARAPRPKQPARRELSDGELVPTVVQPRASTPAILALTGAGAVAFVPESGGYDVMHVAEFSPGDLTGDWASLKRHARQMARVRADDVHLDRDGFLDWTALPDAARDLLVSA